MSFWLIPRHKPVSRSIQSSLNEVKARFPWGVILWHSQHLFWKTWCSLKRPIVIYQGSELKKGKQPVFLPVTGYWSHNWHLFLETPDAIVVHSQSKSLWMQGNQWNFDVHMSGPMGPWIHPMIIFPVWECIVRICILSNWQSPYISSPTNGIVVILIRKAMW